MNACWYCLISSNIFSNKLGKNKLVASVREFFLLTFETLDLVQISKQILFSQKYI